MQQRLLAATVLAVLHQAVQAENVDTVLESILVTAPVMEEPLTVVTDPKAPRQPLPAHDGADYLKTIPGFSVIRKGGADGDPVLRGMAASRINILQDGELILGGCGNRMDPPTAYIYPESFDKVTVIKGPQTVQYGPVGSAGTVLFERQPPHYAEPGREAHGSVLLGSFGRNDQVLGAQGGNEHFYLRGGATRSAMDDYRDGDGQRIHSEFRRWSTDLAAGWTPDTDTRLELSTTFSDGEAAYADRGMDGSKFKRENWGVKFSRRNLSTLVESVDAQAYYNYVDHVMDNYSLRTLSVPMYMVSNPDRKTTGLRLAATLRLGEHGKLTGGLDHQRNVHTLRSGRGMMKPEYRAAARVEDARFNNAGMFAELKQPVGDADQWIAGLRADHWKAEDRRSGVSTAAQQRKKTLFSGFLRHEHDFSDATVGYLGIGHSERFPDYWELISANKQSKHTDSAFHTRPERLTQLDAGLIHEAGPWHLSLAGFANHIDDYILVDTRYADKAGTVIVRNVDARTWGGEAGLGWAAGRWKLDGTLAYVHGNNRSDGTALAQLPPLEMRLNAEYGTEIWSVGGLLRAVAKQDRVAIGTGNIVGQDIGKSSGFAIFSLNGAWKPSRQIRLSAGIDNLFDKLYAEHISRSGADVAGYEQITRINEPGRTYWLKASIQLD